MPGILTFIKSRTGGTGAGGGRGAKPKADPKPAKTIKTGNIKLQNQNKSSTSRNKDKDSGELKVSIGNAGGGNKRTATQAGLDTVPTPSVPGAADEERMSEADLATLKQFNERVAEHMVLSPPLSEDAFKSHLSDLIGKHQVILNEVRIKKSQSAGDVNHQQWIMNSQRRWTR